jgi:hypothetical protein
MATNTYVALSTTVLGSAASSVTFSSISQAYTDLVLVINATADSGNPDSRIKFNGNTSNNMSGTILTGNGTTASSARRTSLIQMEIDWTGMGTGIGQYAVHIMNYANTTTYKTFLVRAAFAAKGSDAIVGMWSNTAAITSITVDIPAGNFATGSTFTLYGIAASSVGAKATGGTIYSDSLYYYHAFLASGTFTPATALSCDILTIAGGGTGGRGGGGAGGLVYAASQALTTASQTVTVGAGGAQRTVDGSGLSNAGTNSQFGSLTASVGGGAAAGFSVNGGVGGSGGGAGWGLGVFTGGAGTSGQGNAGGNNGTGSAGGGGGGAGNNGNNGVGTDPGTGGVGSSTYSSFGLATTTGQNVSGTVYYAGGGGGAGDTSQTTRAGGFGGGGASSSAASSTPTAGTANTGGGGGGGTGSTAIGGAAGGSGIVIIRYAR